MYHIHKHMYTHIYIYRDWADKHGMRLRFVGKIDLLPEKLRKLVVEANETFEK